MNKNLIIIPLILLSNLTFSGENIPKRGIYIEDQKTAFGYDTSDSVIMGELGYIKYLMNVEEREKSQLESSLNKNMDPYDTHIQKNLPSLKLAFKFKPLDFLNIIGYAPEGTYKNGWTGIKVYFKDKLGICTYSRNIISAMSFDKKEIKYSVNGKHTVAYMEGNDEAGYLYTVNWAEETTNKYVLDYVLDCARNDKNDNQLKKMVLLASRIDKS